MTIRLASVPLDTAEDARAALQIAIGVEFGTLPPYLYARHSILPDTNAAACARLDAIIREEMIHLCLACNILNALGGSPRIVAPHYPGPLPGDIGATGKPLTVHLIPFSRDAMAQGMAIEEPEDPHVYPERALLGAAAPSVSIGKFYDDLKTALGKLPSNVWKAGRNQVRDNQYFLGQLFPIDNFADAARAIDAIVSEGEGSVDGPLDFEQQVSHYYRFEEIHRDRVLTKDDNPAGYVWGARLGVDYAASYDAIRDPEEHDFSGEPMAARQAQRACDAAFSTMIDALQGCFDGDAGALGVAVRAMFDLRMAMQVAFTSPLASGKVAGPAFRYLIAGERSDA